MGHLDPAAMKHLEKRGLTQVSDTTVSRGTYGVQCAANANLELFPTEAEAEVRKLPGEVIQTWRDVFTRT